MLTVYNIVTNSRPPACERPRLTNNSRFTHRTCNSVATFRNNAGNQSRVCFGHTTTLSVFYPRVTGSDRRISIYLSTRAGLVPRGCTSTKACLDTNRLSGSFRSGITERCIITRPRWSRFFYRLIKSPLPFRNAIRQFNGENDTTSRFTFK